MKLLRTLPLVLLAAGACQTTVTTTYPASTPPPDALLVEVSPAERQAIADARQACDRAKDDHAAAQAEHRRLAEEVSGVTMDREAARVRVVSAEAALSRANASGTSDDVARARQALQTAKAELAVQDAKVKLRDHQKASAKALADLAAEHVKVAEANVELVKAKAVCTLDRPEIQKPDVAKYEELLRRAETEENVARARADGAQKEVAIATTTLKEREAAAPR